MVTGRDREAIEVIRQIAEFNKRECMLRVEDLEALDAEYGSECIINAVGSRRMTDVAVDPPADGGQAEPGIVVKKKMVFDAKHLKVYNSFRVGLVVLKSLFQGLFATRAITMLTLLTWLCYMADYW